MRRYAAATVSRQASEDLTGMIPPLTRSINYASGVDGRTCAGVTAVHRRAAFAVVIEAGDPRAADAMTHAHVDARPRVADARAKRPNGESW
jgi:hypothetical protein